MYLTDEQWSLIAPLFPPPKSGRGRPLVDERSILDAVLWKLATSSPWYDLPPQFPSHQTVYRRYLLWKRSGLLLDILSVLLEDLSVRGNLDPADLFHNGSITFECKDGTLRMRIDPSLRGTWQLATAMLFLNLAFQKVRRKHAPFK